MSKPAWINLRSVLIAAALLAGVAAGLAYGWLIHPAQASNARLAELRTDYRADAVLMVAEGYQADGDLALARERLSRLGDPSPAVIAQQAVLWASQANYPPEDLKRLADLAAALQTPPAEGTGAAP